MDAVLGQVLVAALAVVSSGGAITQFVANRREKSKGAPLDEAAARLNIAQQLEAERVARQTAERERDDANTRAALNGRERDAADRRAEAADRRANTSQRAADVWERHATDVREACLAHGTPLHLLPPRPSF